MTGYADEHRPWHYGAPAKSDLIGSFHDVRVRGGSFVEASRVSRCEGFEAQYLNEEGTELEVAGSDHTTLILLLSKRAKMATDLLGDRRRIVIPADSFVIVPSGTTSWWDNSGSGGAMIHTTFSHQLLAELREDEGIGGSLKPAAGFFTVALRAAFALLQGELSRLEPEGRIFTESLARLIGLAMLRANADLALGGRSSGGLAGWQLRRVVDYLGAHLDEDVSLVELSNLVGLSPSHFCRAFKDSVGQSPHAWLIEQRMERAREMMLLHPLMGLTEIALSVGYQSQAAFGTAFKRTTGWTPHQWRRERLR